MKTTTREVILRDIDKIKDKINVNKKVIEEHEEFAGINTLTNIILECNIKLLKKALIEDDINVVFEFTDQL